MHRVDINSLEVKPLLWTVAIMMLPKHWAPVTMDVIKAELEVDPLSLDTDEEEKKPILEERNLVDQYLTGIKEEYVDQSHDFKSEIKFEEDPAPVSFAVVKREPEEEQSDFNVGPRVEVTAEDNEVFAERRLRWAGHVARMGESRNAYRVLVGRPEGKRPLGRPRRRWEYNIKMDLREVGYDDRDWINLAQDRDQWRAYVRAAMNHRKATEGIDASTQTPPLASMPGKRIETATQTYVDTATQTAESDDSCGLDIRPYVPRKIAAVTAGKDSRPGRTPQCRTHSSGGGSRSSSQSHPRSRSRSGVRRTASESPQSKTKESQEKVKREDPL
ncbi:hypothetical protein ANN_13787 [Periplaneta americana]|uniref:Uncharacterized protein n=1 Tax=Periplaneta americana TaxID=6978 RepID=A0ABQ8SUH5_PERAM|nr:hypothetical protein ANN_13787 [Periplaneta americana]